MKPKTCLYNFDPNPVLPDVQWLTTQQQVLDAALSTDSRAHPADDPKCRTTGASALANLVNTTANIRSPKDLLYICERVSLANLST
jgi:hypothetical protein